MAGEDASAARARRRALLALLVVGLAARAAAPFFTDVAADAAYYSVMGRSLAADGTLTMPNGTIYFAQGDAPAPSHHYPPLYPALLAAAYVLAGYGAQATQWVAVLTGFALVAVAWWTTRDLYGPEEALFVAAATSCMTYLATLAGMGYSENLVALLYALTLWAILKSLTQPRHIVLGGLFAGLSYLTKSSMGALFILAGLAGLAWRFRHRGVAPTLRDRAYWAAALLFAALIAAWAARNLAVHGSWGTSNFVEAVNDLARERPGELLARAAGKLVLFALFAALLFAPFLPELRALRRNWREEATSGLLLSIALPFAFGVYFSAAFWLYGEGELFWHDNARYILLAWVPLLWLVRGAARRRRGAWWVAALAVLTVALVAHGPHFPEAQLARALAEEAPAGTLVAVKDMPVYYLYPYLADDDADLVPTPWREGSPAVYVVSRDPAPPAPGATLLRHESVWRLDGERHAYLWKTG